MTAFEFNFLSKQVKSFHPRCTVYRKLMAGHQTLQWGFDKPLLMDGNRNFQQYKDQIKFETSNLKLQLMILVNYIEFIIITLMFQNNS